jgi:hypothetical protein
LRRAEKLHSAVGCNLKDQMAKSSNELATNADYTCGGNFGNARNRPVNDSLILVCSAVCKNSKIAKCLADHDLANGAAADNAGRLTKKRSYRMRCSWPRLQSLIAHL